MEHTVLMLDAAKSRNQPRPVDIDTTTDVQCLRRRRDSVSDRNVGTVQMPLSQWPYHIIGQYKSGPSWLSAAVDQMYVRTAHKAGRLLHPQSYTACSGQCSHRNS